MLVKVSDVFPWLLPMVNLGQVRQPLSGVATECVGRGLGCVVVVCEFKAK